MGTLATGGLTSAYTKGTNVRLTNKRTVHRRGGLLMSGAALAAAGLLLTVASRGGRRCGDAERAGRQHGSQHGADNREGVGKAEGVGELVGHDRR